MGRVTQKGYFVPPTPAKTEIDYSQLTVPAATPTEQRTAQPMVKHVVPAVPHVSLVPWVFLASLTVSFALVEVALSLAIR